jgi:hypothetical protein
VGVRRTPPGERCTRRPVDELEQHAESEGAGTGAHHRPPLVRCVRWDGAGGAELAQHRRQIGGDLVRGDDRHGR